MFTRLSIHYRLRLLTRIVVEHYSTHESARAKLLLLSHHRLKKAIAKYNETQKRWLAAWQNNEEEERQKAIILLGTYSFTKKQNIIWHSRVPFHYIYMHISRTECKYVL